MTGQQIRERSEMMIADKAWYNTPRVRSYLQMER